MPKIHPTAIIEGDVTLADDVEIGPRCTITGPVTIGPGTRTIGDVWINGRTTIGAGCTIYPFTTIGFSPQSRGYDPDRIGPGVSIGDNNVLREHVTINRAMTDDGPTRIGDNNYIMAQCHAGHDVQLGNDVTLANSCHLAGHAIIEDKVTIGGGAAVHQFVRVGCGVMLGGNCGTSQDVLPWFVVTSTNVAASLNLIGMRRQGLTSDEIETVRWVFKILNRRGLSVPSATDAIRKRAEEEPSRILDRFTKFLDRSERPICTAFHSRARSGYDVKQ